MKTEKNILIAFVLNLFFSIFELIGGIFTNSFAIISDSIHDLGDAISIGISYFLEKKSKNKPNNKYTYGYLRYSVLGGLITTIILLMGSILVIYHSVIRIINPVNINYQGMIIISIFGIIINFIAAYITHNSDSINQRSVNLHMLEDVLGWIVVFIGSIIIKFTNINIIDPIMSILVSIYIFIHASRNFIEILNIFLVKTPSNINVESLKKHIKNVDGVVDIHHIHIWSMDGIENFATMHIITNNKNKNLKKDIRDELLEHEISHVTIEVENEFEKCLETECNVNKTKKNNHHHH